MSVRKSLEGLKEFILLWKDFHGCFRRALEEEITSAEDEKHFLEVKSRIAQTYETVLRRAGERVQPEDHTIALVTRVPTLRSFKEMTDAQRRRFEAEWHTTFIYLQTVIGRLQGETGRAGQGEWLANGIRIGFRIVIVGILIAVLTWFLMIVIQSLGGETWSGLLHWGAHG